MPALVPRLLAEFTGTGLLVAVVVGSGIMAARLSPGQPGLELLENTLATVAGLAVLIVVLAPVSGAHLNPVVTAADWLLARRSGSGVPGRDALAYMAAQTAGAVGGAVLANLMFALPAVSVSRTARSAPHLWLGEVVATAGLVLVVFALARSGRAVLAPVVVSGGSVRRTGPRRPRRSLTRRSPSAGRSAARSPGSRRDRCRGLSSRNWPAARWAWSWSWSSTRPRPAAPAGPAAGARETAAAGAVSPAGN